MVIRDKEYNHTLGSLTPLDLVTHPDPSPRVAMYFRISIRHMHRKIKEKNCGIHGRACRTWLVKYRTIRRGGLVSCAYMVESWLEARPELQLGLELRQLTPWTRTELWAKCRGEHPRCHLLNG